MVWKNEKISKLKKIKERYIQCGVVMIQKEYIRKNVVMIQCYSFKIKKLKEKYLKIVVDSEILKILKNDEKNL